MYCIVSNDNYFISGLCGSLFYNKPCLNFSYSYYQEKKNMLTLISYNYKIIFYATNFEEACIAYSTPPTLECYIFLASNINFLPKEKINKHIFLNKKYSSYSPLESILNKNKVIKPQPLIFLSFQDLKILCSLAKGIKINKLEGNVKTNYSRFKSLMIKFDCPNKILFLKKITNSKYLYE